MTRTLLKLAAAAALTLPLATQAADLNYSFVELDYRELRVDGPDADGLAVRGSLAFHPQAFVLAEYGDLEFDGGADGESWRLGAGGHVPLNDAWDLVGKLGYANEEVGPFDEDGLFIAGSVRGRITQQLELDIGAEYADLDEPFDELTVFAQGRYNFTNQLAAGLLLRVGDEVTTFGISGRLSF